MKVLKNNVTAKANSFLFTNTFLEKISSFYPTIDSPVSDFGQWFQRRVDPLIFMLCPRTVMNSSGSFLNVTYVDLIVACKVSKHAF